MGLREQYFERIRPVLGDGLRGARVAARNLSLTGRTVELLNACGLDGLIAPGAPETPTWPLDQTCRGPCLDRPAKSARELLLHYLHWKNEFETFRLQEHGRAQLTLEGKLVGTGLAPRVAFDSDRKIIRLEIAQGDLFGQREASWVAAFNAREILLGRKPWPDEPVICGVQAWPFARPRAAPTQLEIPPLKLAGRHLLVIGVGSLGSEFVRLLAASGCRWTLADPGRVSLHNPVRQWYGTSEIGRPKVNCLADRLRPHRVRPILGAFGERTLPHFQALIEEDPPDLALLASGTLDHAALSEKLWALGVPHLAACAFPRARFFEVSPILPAENTPCLHCFRGHLYRGAEAVPALDEELSRFLYEEVPAHGRDQAWTDLVAEPASALETSRIAEVAGRCALEMLRPPPDRAGWFSNLLTESTTCLLGSNRPQKTEDGDWAYGITYPGQVIRLGLGDLAGAEDSLSCPVCHRHLQITHRLQLPTSDDTLIDHALLS